MGLSLNYETLNDPCFTSAIKKIDASTSLPIGEIINFNRIRDTINIEVEKAKECFRKLIEKHAETESVADGDRIVTRPKYIGNGEFAFKDKDAFEKELAVFMATTLEIDAKIIDSKWLESAELSPAEYRAISQLTGDNSWKQKPTSHQKKSKGKASRHGNQRPLGQPL